jgi:hypothetical protein
MSLLEYDLDRPAEPGADPASGGRARPVRSRLLAGMVALAIASCLVGALARAATTQQAPTAVTPVSAWMTVRDVVLGPSPQLLLRLVVADVGTQPVQIDELTMQGGGIFQDTRVLSRRIEPGGVATLDFDSALRCIDPPFRPPPLAAVIRVQDLTTSSVLPSRSVRVTSTGTLGQPGGGCLDAARSLPEGWENPLEVYNTAREARVVDGDLDLMILLPDPDLRVVGVSADGTLLAPANGDQARATGQGAVRLRLQPPIPVCRTVSQRPQVPAGLRLLVMNERAGLGVRYLEVGPVLSHWLRDTYRRACPDAPSTVLTPGA